MSREPLGRFWAVGVGSGDPELLTLKAINILKSAHVIYHAGPERQQGRAWEIIRSQLRPEQEIRLVLTAAMSVVSASDWRVHYRPGVEQIAADCRRGLDVAYVTEGDPTLYSTAACVWQLLHEICPEIPIEIIPGVSSITAAAARVGWPLAQKDELLAVVPASYHRDALGPLLDQFQTVCLLKPSLVLPEILRELEGYGPARETVYIENLGTAKEFISRDLAALADRKSYFALLIVRQTAESKMEGGKLSSSERLGKVWVIGLGPGDPHLLTNEARAVLQRAEVVIGYERYLQALAPLSLHALQLGSPIGAEAERAVQALAAAHAGRQVALVSSGDAGVYGMASLLLETAERLPEVQVEVVPGVTAATAAAALLGAPLGHDFACISLSDLLTPWEVIERRLAAAAQADFVVALYNPISRRRGWQLPRAREILLRYQGPGTPVGLVDKAYRPGQRVWQTTLSDLKPDGISMESLLIIGNSQTRVVHGRMVTPRGYGERQKAKGERRKKSDPGRQIMQESFAIIERELGPHSFPPWTFAVVRRMIHASGDFEFAQTLRYSADFESAIQAALGARLPIVTDTEMMLFGIRAALADRRGVIPSCHLNDPNTAVLANAAGLTRSAAGIRLAARRYATPIVAIGNAPTALAEALRLVEEGTWRPAAIIGMPVGFVGVTESKNRLLTQSQVPYLTCVGRKGGSAVTAAAINALVEHVHS